MILFIFFLDDYYVIERHMPRHADATLRPPLIFAMMPFDMPR